MNGQRLDQVKAEKDLGVLIDDELKFHKQPAAAIKGAATPPPPPSDLFF